MRLIILLGLSQKGKYPSGTCQSRRKRAKETGGMSSWRSSHIGNKSAMQVCHHEELSHEGKVETQTKPSKPVGSQMLGLAAVHRRPIGSIACKKKHI